MAVLAGEKFNPTLILSAPKTVREAAYEPAIENSDSESHVICTYCFPDSEEIRLVHVDTSSLPSEERVTPFYFGRDKYVPFRSAIALVLPEQTEKILLPAGWGDWRDAEKWEWK